MFRSTEGRPQRLFCATVSSVELGSRSLAEQSRAEHAAGQPAGVHQPPITPWPLSCPGICGSRGRLSWRRAIRPLTSDTHSIGDAASVFARTPGGNWSSRSHGVMAVVTSGCWLISSGQTPQQQRGRFRESLFRYLCPAPAPAPAPGRPQEHGGTVGPGFHRQFARIASHDRDGPDGRADWLAGGSKTTLCLCPCPADVRRQRCSRACVCACTCASAYVC